jgi:hypothetical protein
VDNNSSRPSRHSFGLKDLFYQRRIAHKQPSQDVTIVLTPEQARWLDLHLQGEFKGADISGLSDRQNPILLDVGIKVQDAIEAARVGQ